MTEGSSDRNPDYTMGYSEEFQQLLRLRSVETHAAHLLPHLKPGMRLLDFGCGPGNLSVGLARVIEPGELHGIDMEASEIDTANALAQAGEQSNTTFHVGDATDMPFDGDYFDVAHCHTVLMHVPDTQATLGEANRVLKPGGIVSCREAIIGSSFLEPDLGDFKTAWETFGKLLSANSGHPEIGVELKSQVLEAGFGDIRATASFDVFSTPEQVAFFEAFVRDWFLAPNIVDITKKLGLATQEQFDNWDAALTGWKVHPGAFGAIAFGEVIAFKP